MTALRMTNSRKGRLAVGIVLAAALLGVGGWYWNDSLRYIATDNAYVNANVVRIAPLVSGPVKSVAVADNGFVKNGDLLFEIESASFDLTVRKAEAQLELARNMREKTAASVAEAEALVTQRQAEYDNAMADAARIATLVTDGALTPQVGDEAATRGRTTAAALQLAKAALRRQRTDFGGGDNERIREAEAILSQAKLDISHTKVYAPAGGYVTGLTLRYGTVVRANEPLFALIDDREYWMDANFKETELAAIRPGQYALITVDMYPEHIFHGTVESISGGSGSAFSLLPPQNATGNWVKVTQRVPVKIHIDDRSSATLLRIGTTGMVKIRTRG